MTVISSLASDQVVLPQLAGFESFTLLFGIQRGFIGFLSHLRAEIDPILSLTSAGKTASGLS